ncbi:chymotrypsin-like elastase family member 2A [Achroia grisella]|uniref:chymotrypsin-like elastase family member 2A n=1 Tax=Achroia grisella TaxID=688607 RepID=UPI0027D25FCE|nr:chymotrypsin-like elastase family member 2A [Achroia grisella]
MNILCAIVIINVLNYVQASDLAKNWGIVGTPLGSAYPCKGNDVVLAQFEAGLSPEEENKYSLYIGEQFPTHSRIIIKFDSEATVTLVNDKVARIRNVAADLVVFISFFKPGSSLSLIIKGPQTGTVPYPTSIDVNSVEYCKQPAPGFLDSVIEGYKGTAHVAPSVPSGSCGRRKVVHTELIVNGQPTKPGDWPWHGAIYRLEQSSVRYICGGTLLSKTFVLTAAHCVTISGNPVLPEILSIIFGKYHLIGGDIATQEREIQQIIVHEEFNASRLNNDIALMKMKTEVSYDDYVQPACLWHANAYKKLPVGSIMGTVVGWGFNHNDQLASTLHQVVLPKILENHCIKSNTAFFGLLLNNRKFCAGYRNGTSACNGDSGGAYQVFVPDVTGDSSANATGSWHVRGIVSLAMSRPNEPICDNRQYSLFTDVSAFVGWIKTYVKTDN